MEKIAFTIEETGEEVSFCVIEETRINGADYILVTDSADEESDGEALILKDKSADGEREALYEIVDDDAELRDLMKIFAELLDDVDLTM